MYLCYLFNDPRWHSLFSGFSNGTTINMLPVDTFSIPLIVLPPEELVASFSTVAQSALEKVEANLEEARVLEELRDSLLPRLVGGQLRIDSLGVQ